MKFSDEILHPQSNANKQQKILDWIKKMRRTYKQSVSKRDKIEFEKTLHDSYKHPMTISFDLGDDYEIDITAVPPEDDEQEGYVDAVLFLGGQEVCVCEVGHELEGRYYFTDADDKEICLIVE